MAMTKRNGWVCWVACVVASMLVVVGLAGCGGKDKEASADANDVGEETTQGSNTEQASTDPLTSAAELFREPSVTVQKIVNGAKTWDPLFRDYWGKIAPDFTLTDINGNIHKLSNYRGKNVLVVIWQTADARSEKLEVPQLKELRNSFPEKDLAILAISNEAPEVLKAFAAEQAVNFTMLVGAERLEAPFGKVQYVPGSFFINPQGRFKLAARGFVSAAEAKTIVQAQ